MKDNNFGSNVQIRQTLSSDIPQIIEMYNTIFNIKISKGYYNWLYKNKGKYFSTVATDNGKVIGHKAIIEKKYYLRDAQIKVGISSGSMVNPEYAGIYIFLLKKMMYSFTQDIIIGFPNNNSKVFFYKLLNFDSIKSNYFSLKEDEIVMPNDTFTPLDTLIKRDNDFLEWRLLKHPKNTYYKVSKNDCVLYYKKFRNNSIDVVYSSLFNYDFFEIINELSQKFQSINIIHWNQNWITSLGFKPEENNSFAYKWNDKNENAVKFECQMIDSDVF